MADVATHKHWRWILLSAVAAYCVIALCLILQRPGLQYDEALLVEGSVQMRISPAELPLPHDPDTWICPFGRCFPLMTVRYVGSAKEYLCLPVFAIFGNNTVALRLLSALLGALGIWGIAALVRTQAGAPAAAATAWILALNPAYADMSVFDNDAFAISMAALGLLSMAIAAYLKKQNPSAAFWAGAAIAFLVWARANLVWMLAALSLAALLTLGKRLLLPRSHWIAALAGGLVGGFPFLAYQLLSKGGTWQGLSMFSSGGTLREQLFNRLISFSETLLSDREHRAMWQGPPMPDWQRWLFPAIVLVSCLACLLIKTNGRAIFARLIAIAFLMFAAILFFARVNLSEHHLIELLPFAAVLTVLASTLISRYRWGKALLAVLAMVYVVSALIWQVSAIRGLRTTGGVGPWSDGIAPLAQYLEQHYPNREVQILDWGLEYNLFVLSGGKLHIREVYEDATEQQSMRHRPWIEEIRDGGVYLLNGPDNRQFPVASTGFLHAVEESRPLTRWHTIKQRNGATFAQIVEIEPNSLGQGSSPEAASVSTVSTGDERFANQLEGFHKIEEGGWRWTKREFSITLTAPDASGGGNARLSVDLYIPAPVVQKLGAITLRARLGSHQLAPETYRQEGQFTYARDLDASWLTAGPNRFDFTLDKSLPPNPPEERELGIIVQRATLAK
ncbi:MAG TPA: glycosyltransferase family 39 protein [Bryobacteraceae bacterium]|nr:glycosyltransferase family 39 protein [Bryobacteraceae bacterium]